MTKDIIAGMVFIILLFLVQLILPWWSAVIICALFCYYLDLSYLQSIIVGFTSLFIMWGVIALWLDVQNQSLLSDQIGQLLGGMSSNLLILSTALLGGICGLLGSVVGKSARVIGGDKTLV